MLKDGRAESLCKVIRSLVVFAKNHPLNDNDQALLKRAQTALLAEWSHALSVTPAQVEAQLHKLIGVPHAEHGSLTSPSRMNERARRIAWLFSFRVRVCRAISPGAWA